MQTRIGSVPVGVHEGSPALVATIAANENAHQVVEQAARAARPGTLHLLMEDAPWDQEILDEVLGALAGDQRTADLEPAAIRAIGATRWANAGVWWIGDASQLLTSKTTVSDLVTTLASVPYHPHLAEIVVIDPAPENVDPAILDELYSRLDTMQGWIYVSTAKYPHAMLDRLAGRVALCETPWGLRRKA